VLSGLLRRTASPKTCSRARPKRIRAHVPGWRSTWSGGARETVDRATPAALAMSAIDTRGLLPVVIVRLALG
jgi:hypothetical protein